MTLGLDPGWHPLNPTTSPAPREERVQVAEAEIERRRQQQAALAELAQGALARVDVDLLIGQTCAVVEWALGVSYVTISDGDLQQRFGLGSNPTFHQCNEDEDIHRPLLLHTLAINEPVVFSNAAADPRLRGDHLIAEHGVQAGASMPIPGRERAFGVLTVYSDRLRTFAPDEIAFLKAVADLTGAVINNAETEEARRRSESERVQSEDRFRALVENAADGIALVDATGQFLYAGPSTRHVLGYDGAALVGRNFAELVHPEDIQLARGKLHELLSAANTQLRGEVRLLHAQAGWRWVEGTYTNLLAHAAVGAIVMNYRDVTERRLAEEQLEDLAYRDTLTGLPNRFLFHDRLAHAIEQARRRNSGLGLMYVDLDRFKVVNDTLGHSAGDRLLQIVGTRLRETLRADDTIARLGGDEFAIILPEIDRAEDAGSVARKLLTTLRQPITVDGHELHVTGSIGISIFPSDGMDVVTLLKHADAALYRSKDLGRNTVQLYASSMNARYTERLELELALHLAVDRNEFRLVYQPLIDTATQTIRAFEALVRWERPGHGLVSPQAFIPLAEETRLIIPMGSWVLRTACAQLREWRDAGAEGFHMAVNLSAHQIAQPGFIELVHETLQANDLEPSALELEITESAALQNLEWTLSVLDQLKGLGVRIAVDDFGTGQSSLAYLKRFPLNTLKIDREFMRDVQSSSADAAILAAIISLGHSLGLYVIAEGIENDADRRMVEAEGCDGVQGYLFGQPVPADAVRDYIEAFRYPEGSACAPHAS